MNSKIKQFYRASNPSRTLDISKPEDRKFYIDFSSVRGGQMIEVLKTSILWADENEFTCNLFTGHVGCGKSTELLYLKKELEEEGFLVIYFESDEDLDMGNVDISDILLAIARRVSQSLEDLKSDRESKIFQDLLQRAKKLFLGEIRINAKGNIPGVGDLEIDLGGEDDLKVSFSNAISEITIASKRNRDLQDRLRAYLEPKTEGILNVLNQGLFAPTGQQLQELGKQGLVIIVDNLDKLLKIETASNRFLPQYIFADRGTDLTRLQCHLVYTMPLALRYSNDYGSIKEKFKVNPFVLPMVPVKSRDGQVNPEGMELLRKMVLVRVPNFQEEKESDIIEQFFGSLETLDYLCSMSGGHVRNLLIILRSWIMKARTLPLDREKLEEVLVNQRIEMTASITKDEWKLIRSIQQKKDLAGDDHYDKLIHNRFVFEYRDFESSWYDINPLLEKGT